MIAVLLTAALHLQSRLRTSILEKRGRGYFREP